MVTGVNIFLAFNRHSHSPRYTYHSELWADRAGYFVYLPAAIKHDFDPSQFPAGIDTLTGSGFHLDIEKSKIVTKYTYGVALLQAPFYLIGHGLASVFSIPTETFGALDHAIVNIAGPFYGVLGSMFIFCFLRSRYGNRTALWTTMGVYLGTNVFYYTVADPGMSHVYSFFLFAVLILLAGRLKSGGEITWGFWALIGSVVGLITVIRPTNMIFLMMIPVLFEYLFPNGSAGRRVHVPLFGLTLIGGGLLLCWLPQMMYWDQVHHTMLKWSYDNEGFTNWNSPHIIEFWLAPQNGILPYTPLILLVFPGIHLLGRSGSRALSKVLLAILVMITYIGSAWWVWHFGCGLGSRTLVEYWAVFAIPLAAWVDTTLKKWGLKLPVLVLLLFALHQIKVTYSYDGCWHTPTWDWHTYWQLVFGPAK